MALVWVALLWALGVLRPVAGAAFVVLGGTVALAGSCTLLVPPPSGAEALVLLAGASLVAGGLGLLRRR